MKGRTPKRPQDLQRRNKHPTAAQLIESSPLTDGQHPELPDMSDLDEPWRNEVTAWWADLWNSPMATEYTQADVHGLIMIAHLMQRFYQKPTASTAAEIRQQRAVYGLTPFDRRRLQWEIKRVTQDEKPKASKKPERVDDPRKLFKAV